MKLEFQSVIKNNEIQVNCTMKLNETQIESIDNLFDLLEDIEWSTEKYYADRFFLDSEKYDKLEKIKNKIDYLLYDVIISKED